MQSDHGTDGVPTELLYVSWGGTGRAASVRSAMRRAVSEQRALRYLAVLDDEHFSDLDRQMTELVSDELFWLLSAQIELTRSQLGVADLAVEIEVKAGQVVELVAETVAEVGKTTILIGAPVPVAGHDSVQSMIDSISSQTGCEVLVVMPDAT